MPEFWDTRSPQTRSTQAIAPHWEEKRLEVRTLKMLDEACRCHAVWALSAGREGYSLDLPEDDFVSQYADFRAACPNKGKMGHEAFCQRCDNSFPSTIGGANVLRQDGWREINPLEKFPEPIRPRQGPKVSP